MIASDPLVRRLLDAVEGQNGGSYKKPVYTHQIDLE